MKSIPFIVSLCFLVALFASLMGGCKSDSAPTEPTSGTTTYPSVAQYWSGYAILSNGTRFDLTAALGQSLDKLNGFCVWMTSGTTQSVVNYDGTITSSRQIALRGISYRGKLAQWDTGVTPQLDAWTATLAAGGDTISGKFAGQINSNAGGTFVLVKKSGSGTSPTVAATWKGVGDNNFAGYDLSANFVQALDVLIGDWTWSRVGSPNTLKEYFTGNITATRDIQLQGYAYESNYVTSWNPSMISATASVHVDTISGSWKDAIGDRGSLLLVKQ